MKSIDKIDEKFRAVCKKAKTKENRFVSRVMFVMKMCEILYTCIDLHSLYMNMVLMPSSPYCLPFLSCACVCGLTEGIISMQANFNFIGLPVITRITPETLPYEKVRDACCLVDSISAALSGPCASPRKERGLVS